MDMLFPGREASDNGPYYETVQVYINFRYLALANMNLIMRACVI